MIRSYGAFILSFAILTFLLPVPYIRGQDITWVTEEGTGAMDGFTREEARDRAVKDALRKAVRKAVGADISEESLVINFRLSGSIVNAIPYGRVTDTAIIEEGVVNVHRDGQQSPSRAYRVKIRAGVVEEKSGADASFRIEAVLDRSSYKDGDEMALKIRSTKDCYIAVFNIVEGEKIIRLFPNKFQESNFVLAGNTFSFPDQRDRKRGIKLKAHLPPGRDRLTETFYILAVKKPFTFETAGIQQGIFGFYDGHTAFMGELVKEIVSIPLNERAEQLIQYQIKK